jgi:hypothetical protein
VLLFFVGSKDERMLLLIACPKLLHVYDFFQLFPVRFSGTAFLQQFCASAVNAVVSPFILYDLAMEAATFLSRNSPAHMSNQLRTNILNPVFQKCLQM